MSPTNRNLLLLTLNVAVWTINALTYKGSIRLNARSGVPVTIDMDPPRARLSVDGTSWEGFGIQDGWIQSPAIIRLPAGQHKMLLERPGYAPHRFKTLVTQGDRLVLTMALEVLEGADHSVEILGEGPDSDTIFATLDDGLESGDLPIKADDLMPGQHIISFTIKGLDGLRKKPYMCAFDIGKNDVNLITKITVSRAGKKLKVAGCKRLKSP